MKTESFCASNDTINRVKGNPWNKRKIFANHVI